MKINQPEKRLSSLWGYIDRQHNDEIARQLVPASQVLDVGCGYGSLVHYLATKAHQAEGIDLDGQALQIAKQLFPTIQVSQISAENLSLNRTTYYDAIILKDCLHHIMGEHEPTSAFAAFHQLLKPSGLVIILDPNPMLILRLSRQLIRHVDPEATLPDALRLLESAAFEVKKIYYYEVIGLPLSGGYVGWQLVPNLKFLNRTVALVNYGLSALMNTLSLGRVFCWRYLIVAQKREV